LPGNVFASTPLISMSEIAELAEVRRPVVTTWRRRHPNFPKPVGEDRGQPLFHAQEIIDWLVDTGRGQRDTLEPDLGLHLLTSLANGTRSTGRAAHRRLTARELTIAITALICLRHLDDEPLHPPGLASGQVVAEWRDRAGRVDPHDRLLRAEIEALPADAGWLAEPVDGLVEAAWGAPQAFERVLANRHRLHAPDLCPDAITPATARLVARLSGAREHAQAYDQVLIADPMAGSGDLLMAVHAELGEHALSSLAAAVTDAQLARLLRRRLIVHGVPATDAPVAIGTELPAVPGLAGVDCDPDVLVTHLPYRPKEERDAIDPLDALRQIIERLTPGRTAVVLGPADLLVGILPPYQPAARTRNELLRSGRVEAIINLPEGLVPFRPGYRLALWVLRHEQHATVWGRVLLADVADRKLTDELVDTLVWDITTWRREGQHHRVHLRAYASEVDIAELTRPRRLLTTRRPPGIDELTRDPQQVIAGVTGLEAELDQLVTSATEQPPLRTRLGTRQRRTRPRLEPISALIRAGHLARLSGHRIAPKDIVGDGHHPVLGRPELTGATHRPRRTLERGVFATRYPRARLTEPGDVVVTLTPRFGVHLDRDGYSVVEFPAQALRTLPGDRPRFTPRVLAALLAATAPDERPAGAVRPGARLDELQLPLLPPDEVARLDLLLADLETRETALTRQRHLLDELRRIAVDGLTSGELTILRPP
jgi:hypothetical protein